MSMTNLQPNSEDALLLEQSCLACARFALDLLAVTVEIFFPGLFIKEALIQVRVSHWCVGQCTKCSPIAQPYRSLHFLNPAPSLHLAPAPGAQGGGLTHGCFLGNPGSSKLYDDMGYLSS